MGQDPGIDFNQYRTEVTALVLTLGKQFLLMLELLAIHLSPHLYANVFKLIADWEPVLGRKHQQQQDWFVMFTCEPA